jgi:hypothetical protein
MRMLSVPVIDADPIQFRAEILLHLTHEVAGEGLEVRYLDRILGRDDEPEMMPVVLTPLREILRIDAVGFRAEQMGLLSITGDALALYDGPGGLDSFRGE